MVMDNGSSSQGVSMNTSEVVAGKVAACVLIALIVGWFTAFGILQAYQPREIPDSKFIRVVGEWGVDFAFAHPIIVIVILLCIFSVGAIGDDAEEVRVKQQAADATLKPYLEQMRAQEAAAEQDLRRSVQKASPFDTQVQITHQGK
jgi:hypothetical protein